MSEIRRWLEGLGLGQYAAAFDAGVIGIELLPELDHDVLKDLGVSVPGHRLKIIKAARGESPGVLPTAPGPTKKRTRPTMRWTRGQRPTPNGASSPSCFATW